MTCEVEKEAEEEKQLKEPNQLLYNVCLIKMPLVTLPTAGAGHPATSWLPASSDIYPDCSESSNTRESNLKYLMTFSGCSEIKLLQVWLPAGLTNLVHLGLSHVTTIDLQQLSHVL